MEYSSTSGPPPPLPLPAKKMKRGKKVLIGFLIAGGVLLLGVLFIAGAGALFYFTAQEIEVTENQKACFVDAEAISEYADIEVDSIYESIEAKRYIDQSSEYFYLYNDDDGYVYLDTTITIEKNLSDAVISYGAISGGDKLGRKIGGWEGGKDNEFSWGDASTFSAYDQGFSFAARKGFKIFYVSVIGVEFESHDDVKQLLTKHLERFDETTF